MHYRKNDIVAAKILKIKDHRINILMPNGETTAIYSEDFCANQSVSLKNRVSVGEEIKVIVKGYAEDGKAIASHKELLGTFAQNLSLIGCTAKGGFISDSIIVTVIDIKHNMARGARSVLSNWTRNAHRLSSRRLRNILLVNGQFYH